MNQHTIDLSHTESQRERLKKLLDSGRSITPLDAFNLVGTMKVATRISELIREGYPIVKSWKVVKNRFNEDVRVRVYCKGERLKKREQNEC